MVDPDPDHRLVYTEHGILDLARSSYFDPEFGSDTTVEGSVRRVRFLIQEMVEASLGINQWYQVLHPEAEIHLVSATLQQGLTSRSSPIVLKFAIPEVHPVTLADAAEERSGARKRWMNGEGR